MYLELTFARILCFALPQYLTQSQPFKAHIFPLDWPSDPRAVMLTYCDIFVFVYLLAMIEMC